MVNRDSKDTLHTLDDERLPASNDLLVSRALELFREKPEVRWSVKRIAHELRTSRAELARRFSRSLARSPLAVLRGIRMERAASLLTETDHGLARVADAVGYDSEFAFSRAFFRYHGSRPGAFRRDAARAGEFSARYAA